MAHKPACVVDCGTGYTKIGYSGNVTPQYIIPTATAHKLQTGGAEGKVRDVSVDRYFK